MSRIITFLIMSIACLALPEFLSVSMGVLGGLPTEVTIQPNTMQELTNNMAQLSKTMIDVVSAMSYLVGIAFGIKTALELKKYAEGNFIEEVAGEPEQIIEKVDLIKKEIPIKKELIVNELFLTTGENDLDKIILKITKKVELLKNNGQLQNDLENKLIVEKTMKEYLPKIVKTYNEVSTELKNKKGVDNFSAHDMAKEQLEIVYGGISQIELSLLSKNHNQQKVMGKFLANRFDKKLEQEIEMN